MWFTLENSEFDGLRKIIFLLVLILFCLPARKSAGFVPTFEIILVVLNQKPVWVYFGVYSILEENLWLSKDITFFVFIQIENYESWGVNWVYKKIHLANFRVPGHTIGRICAHIWGYFSFFQPKTALSLFWILHHIGGRKHLTF